jgi:hypothetical protein
MKIKPKMDSIFGDLIAAAFRGWRASRVEGKPQRASRVRLVAFREQTYLLISSSMGKGV